MNIQTVVDSIKALSAKSSFEVETRLSCDWHRGVEYGAISEHTTLTRLNFRRVYNDIFVLTVGLTHKCPMGSFRDKLIRKAPYYCKQCAQCVISADQGIGFILPVDKTIVPKMQISIATVNYKSDPKTDFDIGNMVLTRFDGWVHKCPSVPASVHTHNRAYVYTKQTLKSLPFKCKLCKQHICEEGVTFQKLVAMASVLKVGA